MRHPRDYSFFAEVARFYHLKREAPTPADNLTPRERRLLELGRRFEDQSEEELLGVSCYFCVLA
jgi:hypothetical protein